MDPENCIRSVSSKIDAIIKVMQKSGFKLEVISYFGSQKLDAIIEGNAIFDVAIFGVQLYIQFNASLNFFINSLVINFDILP